MSSWKAQKSALHCIVISLKPKRNNRAMLPIHDRKSQTHPFIHQPVQNSHRRRSSIIISKRRNSPLPILRLRVHVPSLNGNHATLNRANRCLRTRASSRCTRSSSRRTQSAERSHHAAWRHWDLDVFWAAGNKIFWQAVDMNALSYKVKSSSQHCIPDINIASFTYPSCCKKQG
jgi:hypothetical protein